MERVMTLSCLRTSLTTMLLCSGVVRQHSTERQCCASASSFSSSPPWKMMFRVCPSITSPNLGLGASGAEGVVGMMPKSFLFGLSRSQFFFTSSRVKFKRDSQVSCEKTDVVLEIVISISLYSTAPCQMYVCIITPVGSRLSDKHQGKFTEKCTDSSDWRLFHYDTIQSLSENTARFISQLTEVRNYFKRKYSNLYIRKTYVCLC